MENEWINKFDWKLQSYKDVYPLEKFHPYFGKFHPLIPERFIENYSKKGDYIFDPFCGCGTTLFAANKLGSQKILSALVKNGINRDDAYRSIQDLTFDDSSTEDMVKELSEKYRLDPNLISDFIEEETALVNDEESFNNKFQ